MIGFVFPASNVSAMSNRQLSYPFVIVNEPTKNFCPQHATNPYAPPRSSSVEGGFNESLVVNLVGKPSGKDSKAYLKSDGHVSLLNFVGCIVGAGLLLFNAIMWRSAVLVITVGFTGFLVVTMFVSTMPYRISLLHNLNPHWDWLDATEISLSGVTVCYARSSHAHRWEGFSHAVVGRNVIASIPVTQSATLVLVSKSMLQIGSSQQTKDDRDSILDVVKKKL